jgi:hypothetical protein
MNFTILFLLFVCLTARGIDADAPKHVTKTSHKAFDIPKEVVNFVSNLIETNPEVRTQYEKLTATTQEAAGGRFAVGKLVAIEWLVPNFENDFRDTGGTRDGEYVYLVQQQLVAGFHHGYSVMDNVVARVQVKLHEDHARDRKARDGFRLTSSSLDLTFDGFFGVTLTPK